MNTSAPSGVLALRALWVVSQGARPGRPLGDESSLMLSREDTFRNADETSETCRTENSWSLRRVGKIWQDGTPYLRGVALFASGRLYQASCS